MTEESVVLAVALSDRDWDSGVSGWRCGALAIPGAYVDKLYIKGRQVDTATPRDDIGVAVIELNGVHGHGGIGNNRPRLFNLASENRRMLARIRHTS